MGADIFTRAALEKQLDEPIKAGNVELADRLCRELSAYEDSRPLDMPADFPDQVARQAEKGSRKMKRKTTRRLVASVAAFAIVLSFGVTAYAQGWINNLVTVFEQDKMVVTGEQEVDLEQYNKERANATDKTTTYADFATACAAYNLPTALPEELTAANGYKQVNEVTALEVSGQHNAVNILAKYERRQESIDINYSKSADFEQFIINYQSHSAISNQREFISTQGDKFTLYTLTAGDDTYEDAIISLNDYVYQISFNQCADQTIEKILNSLDLSALK